VFVTVRLFRRCPVSVRTRRRTQSVTDTIGRPRLVLEVPGVRADHRYRRRPIPAMIGAGRDQLQTPQSSVTCANFARDLDRDERRRFRGACNCLWKHASYAI
jgi:hypothetical protein